MTLLTGKIHGQRSFPGDEEIKQGKLVAGACNRLVLLFNAFDILAFS